MGEPAGDPVAIRPTQSHLITKLPQELEEGNVEYKLKLTDLSHSTLRGMYHPGFISLIWHALRALSRINNPTALAIERRQGGGVLRSTSFLLLVEMRQLV